MFRKMNRVKFPLSLFLFVFFIGGCDPSSKNRMEFYDRTASIELSDENIKSISIHSSKNKVIEMFGKPDFVDPVEQPKSSYYIYGKDETNHDVEFRLVSGEVKSYFIASGKYTTSKGISKGSNKKDVMKAYGDHFYERTDTGANIIGYFDKVHKMNIEFGISNNQVAGIIVSEMN